MLEDGGATANMAPFTERAEHAATSRRPSVLRQTIGWTFERMPTRRHLSGLRATPAATASQPSSTAASPTSRRVRSSGCPYLVGRRPRHALAQARSAGATVLRPPFDVPGAGRIAILQQPGGGIVGWMTASPRRLTSRAPVPAKARRATSGGGMDDRDSSLRDHPAALVPPGRRVHARLRADEHDLLQPEADDARPGRRAADRRGARREGGGARRRPCRRARDGRGAARGRDRRDERGRRPADRAPSSCARPRRSTARKSLIEGLAEGESLAGQAVSSCVEDVTTTGGSALKAVAALRAAGARSSTSSRSSTARRARRSLRRRGHRCMRCSARASSREVGTRAEPLTLRRAG